MCVIIVEGRSLLSYGIDVVYPRFQWARWSRWVICGDPSITCTLLMDEFGLQEVDAVLDVGVDPIYPRGCDQMEGHWSPITAK